MTQRFRIGQRVRFRRPDGKVCTDTVRARFTQTELLEPYARNRSYPALVLTEHSWCAESDVIDDRAMLHAHMGRGGKVDGYR